MPEHPERSSGGPFEVEFSGVHYVLELPNADTDYIQGRIRETGRPYEERMLLDMASRIGPGELLLDVGANVGNHSVALAAATGCDVVAFEPNPALARAIESSANINGLSDKIRVLDSAVTARDGRAKFIHVDPKNLGAQRIGYGDDPSDPISAIALDSLEWPTRVRMIKIDVEGMELDVLAGARHLLRRDRPLLYVECARERSWVDIALRLGELTYLPIRTFNATPTHLFAPASEPGVLQDAAANASQMTRLYIRLFERCEGLGSPPGEPYGP